MAIAPSSAAEQQAIRSKRRWGYIVWSAALGFVFIPEILAAIPLTESQLPFPTISRTVGHLEYANNAWEILPTMLIVFVLYSLRRPLASPGVAANRRVARRERSDAEVEARIEEELRVLRFEVQACAAALIIAGITWLAFREWPNRYEELPNGQLHKLPNFHVAYWLYGSIALLWLVLPSATAYLRGKKAAFTSLFVTVENLEAAIGKDRTNATSDRIGKAAAWAISFALVWGMVFLMLHLTLYPFPNITHILNRGG